MRYSRVYLESLEYELPPIVVTSEELEERIAPVYKTLHIPQGQLEALTGITERRFWPEGFRVSQGAVLATKKLLESACVPAKEIDTLIYAGVCRDGFEPATATFVASSLGLSENSLVYDISNACLGVLNGILDIANRIELGQSKAGLVVSCESAREINDITIQRLLAQPEMPLFIKSLATFTGGSGAIACLLTDGSFSPRHKPRLLGGTVFSAPQFCELCRWGMQPKGNGIFTEQMYTDSVAVLENGVKLGEKTWRKFLDSLAWSSPMVDKTICHQVGSSHRETILKTIHIQPEKDFITYPFLGNIGTVSLPITAAIAQEREFLKPQDRVAFLGIGSGLNCMMLGWEW